MLYFLQEQPNLPSLIEFSIFKRLFGSLDSVRTMPGLGTSGISSWSDNFLNTSSDTSGINSSISLSLSDLPLYFDASGLTETLQNQSNLEN